MGPEIFLAGASLQGGQGGIARVTRLMARVLAEEAVAGRLRAAALAVSEPSPADLPFPVTTARGCRPCFVYQVYKAALRFSAFLYDHLGIARAHCRLPFLRRPFLVWIHGVEIWERARAAHLRVARRAHLIVVNSRYTRDRADALHGGLAAAAICWLATESDEPPPSPPRFDGRPTVLILGRIDVGIDLYKGHTDLIACWPKVLSAVPGARLLIVGNGPGLGELRRQAASTSAADHIEFRGFIPDSQMEAVWREATVFAMPSRGEGFGLVYIEAMRQSLPIIASIHDAAPEVNLDGVTGHNVSLDDRDALPERIIHLFRNPDEAARLGRNGAARWHEHFRYPAFRGRFLPLLHKVINGRGG